MKGKNMLSILVILTIIAGSFSILTMGITVTSSPLESDVVTNDAAISDREEVIPITDTFVINRTTIDPLTGEKGKYGFDTNVVVEPSGTLIVENATVYFLSDEDHHYSLTVKGSLLFYNATLTIGKGLIQPYYPFSLNIEGPGWAKVEIRNSKLLYPGWFNVTNKPGNVFIINSVFDRMSGGPLDHPPSYGPLPYIYNSRLYIVGTYFKSLPKRSSSGSGPIGWLFNNTEINLPPSSDGGFGLYGVRAGQDNVTLSDFTRSINPEYANFWEYIILKDIWVNVVYSNDTDYDQSSLLQIIYKGKYENTYLANFTIEGAKEGQGELNQTVPLDNYNFTGNTFFSDLQSGKIVVQLTSPKKGNLTIYNVTLFLNVENNLRVDGIRGYAFNVEKSTIFAKDIYVDVDYKPRKYLGTTHNMFNITGDSKLYLLNLTINDTGTEKREDSAFLFQDSSSEVYILRYVVANVTFRGHPIDGLNVYATPYPVDYCNDPQLISHIVDVINTYITNTQSVDSMSFGHVAGNTIWDSTVKGETVLPLLSDILNKSESPNSKFIGIYNISVENETKQFAAVQIGLNYYPWILRENNTIRYNLILEKYRDVDLEIDEMKILNTQPYMVGEDVSLSVKVLNLGKDKATTPMLSIYINSQLYDNFTLSDIEGQSSYTKSITIPGSYFNTVGSYIIEAKVYQLWDYNMDNDAKNVSISIGEIYATGWSPSEVIRHHIVNISATIYSTYEWDDVEVSLYLDDESNLLTQYTTDLQVGNNPFVYRWDVDDIPNGTHTLLLYVNSKFVGSYGLSVIPDVDLALSSVSISPSEIYVGESVDISVDAVNNGKDLPTNAMIYISIYDSYGHLLINKTFSYPSIYEVSFIPSSPGLYSLQIKVVSSQDYNSQNNDYTATFEVLPIPFSLSVNGENEYLNGTDIEINVTIYSDISAQLNVHLEVVELGIAVEPVNGNPVTVDAKSSVVLQFVIPKDKYLTYLQGKTSVELTYYVIITSNRTGDAEYSFGPEKMTVREIADLTLVPDSFVVIQDGKSITKVAEGVSVSIKFEVVNTGGLPANLCYLLLDGDNVLENKTLGIIVPGEKIEVQYNYTVKGIDTHILRVVLNPARNVTERNYENNNATITLDVTPPEMEIVFAKYSEEHQNVIYEGDHLIVIIKVINKNATESRGKTVYMSNVTVSLNLGNLGKYSAMTTEYGVARFVIPVNKVGEFTPLVTLEYYGSIRSLTLTGDEYKIVTEPKPLKIPWLWIIIVVIVAAVGGFFLYGFLRFRKKAKEYMLCGNCGRLVPADAERCPYCGVVFEKEKVKCPECGSWIDEDAKYCPVCGALFIDKEDPEYDKFAEMKSKYERYLEKYKLEARKYIGKEFTAEEFFKWWKTHPEFISFQEWLKRQEERIEGETVLCPVCGAVNPKGAKICRVCGSPLPSEEKEEAPEEKEEEKEEKTPMLKPEEYERLKRPGVITVEEWAKKKGKLPEKEEKKEEKVEEKPSEEETREKEEKKPVVKKKVIKKVIALEEEKKEKS